MKHHLFDTAATVPGLTVVADVFDQDDLFQTLDNSDVLALSQLGGASGFSSTKAIMRSTGVATRRVLNAGVTPLDLAIAICRKVESVSETPLADFDHILLCHSHTDPNACQRLGAELTDALGLSEGSISPFNYGCAGYLKLVTEGSRLLEGGESGTKVALLSVETPEFWHDASDRLFCGIVSAGATGGVLEVGAGLSLDVVKSDDFRIPAERRPNPDPLFRKDTTDVFDFQKQPCHRTVMRMNPEPVFLNGIELMLDNLRSALLSVNPAPGERIVVAPHQPSGKLLRALVAAGRMEFPEIEFLNNLEFYGNIISSSVPTLVSRMDEVLARNELKPLSDGDHVILLAAGICMSEIDNHMSAGHVCLRWQTNVLNVTDARIASDASVSL